jgi:two-component system response regulator AtoC
LQKNLKHSQVTKLVGTGKAITPTALIVEEKPHLRKVLAKWFRQKGYRVCEAASEKGAIELIRNFLFDVVIVDQPLTAGLTGIKILSQHTLVSPDGLRILLATAFHSDELRNGCRQINAFYVEKTALLTQLIGQLELLLRGDQITRR